MNNMLFEDSLHPKLGVNKDGSVILDHSQKGVHVFIANGRNHYIRNTCDVPKNYMEYDNLIAVEKDYEKKMISAAEVIRQFECASFYNEDDTFDDELYERWIYFITTHLELSELSG